ncbi:hypothetical protein C3L33_19917, partial [Rhododendron williamsianum]
MKNLPKSTVDIVLKNEKGADYNVVYIGKRVGLSGGWRVFALDQKLDDGDALVFELVEHLRRKTSLVDYASSDEEDEAEVSKEEEIGSFQSSKDESK